MNRVRFLNDEYYEKYFAVILLEDINRYITFRRKEIIDEIEKISELCPSIEAELRDRSSTYIAYSDSFQCELNKKIKSIHKQIDKHL